VASRRRVPADAGLFDDPRFRSVSGLCSCGESRRHPDSAHAPHTRPHWLTQTSQPDPGPDERTPQGQAQPADSVALARAGLVLGTHPLPGGQLAGRNTSRLSLPRRPRHRLGPGPAPGATDHVRRTAHASTQHGGARESERDARAAGLAAWPYCQRAPLQRRHLCT